MLQAIRSVQHKATHLSSSYTLLPCWRKRSARVIKFSMNPHRDTWTRDEDIAIGITKGVKIRKQYS
jgi:hypothetical protein